LQEARLRAHSRRVAGGVANLRRQISRARSNSLSASVGHGRIDEILGPTPLGAQVVSQRRGVAEARAACAAT
jgi:hypothetical protein